MFQPYLWQHIDVQMKTEEVVRLMVGLPCHRHSVGFFIVPFKAPAKGHPFSNYSEKPDPSIAQWDSTKWLNCHWINTCDILGVAYPHPLLGIVFPPQLNRCATGVVFDLWSEGRLFEPRCPRAIGGCTSDGYEVKTHIRAFKLVSG